jgi:hypothetical protein
MEGKKVIGTLLLVLFAFLVLTAFADTVLAQGRDNSENRGDRDDDRDRDRDDDRDRDGGRSGGSGGSGDGGAPEIDASLAVTGLTLLSLGALMLTDRRRRMPNPVAN